jgi:T5orf172 domain
MYEVTVACPQCRQPNCFLIPSPADSQFQCAACRASILTITPIQGFVYILSNEKMPGLVKVGFTTRTVAERLAELNSMTGVPAPFVVEAYFASSKPATDEAAVHTRLAPFRLANKEFFNCSVESAIEAVEKALERVPVFVFQKKQRIPQIQRTEKSFPGFGSKIISYSK